MAQPTLFRPVSITKCYRAGENRLRAVRNAVLGGSSRQYGLSQTMTDGIPMACQGHTTPYLPRFLSHCDNFSLSSFSASVRAWWSLTTEKPNDIKMDKPSKMWLRSMSKIDGGQGMVRPFHAPAIPVDPSLTKSISARLHISALIVPPTFRPLSHFGSPSRSRIGSARPSWRCGRFPPWLGTRLHYWFD